MKYISFKKNHRCEDTVFLESSSSVLLIRDGGLVEWEILLEWTNDLWQLWQEPSGHFFGPYWKKMIELATSG